MKKLYATLALASLVSLAGAQSQRLVLVEEFTQASCGPCAAANPQFNTLLNANMNKAVALKYQVSWPGVDPMNAQYPTISSRANYYSVSSVPYALMDGVAVTGSSYPGYPNNLNQAGVNTGYAVTSPFDLAVEHTLNAAQDSIFITVHATATQASNFAYPRLHTVLIEKHINFTTAPGSNGETDFYNVVRRMLPTPAGRTLVNNWTVGQDTILTYAVAIPSYIYDINELAVVSFIQDNGTKQVQQAGFSISPVGIHNEANSPGAVNLFPNPASSTTRISFNNPNSSDVTIHVYNTAGMLLRTENRSMMAAGKQEADIDVKMLANGIYIVELITGEMKLTKRLNVIH
ncbi:MAG: hypothetical protein FD123_608 [Bacteroidetes bacterium]|nr:MAG: hypothetical protein FD123_608 [Bacteroidota bacterium]